MPDSTPQGRGRTSVSSFPTVAILDLNSLAHNVEQVRRRIPPDCEIVAVVKADAYGHGAVPITQALQGLNVRRFGVSSLEEGLELRRAGVRDHILIMGALMPEELPEAVAHALTPLICDRDTAERLAGRLVRLLAGLVADPDRPLSRVEILDEDERRGLLQDWNHLRPAPERVTFPDAFAAQVAARPEAVAVEMDGEQLTYRELAERAGRLAHALVEVGAGPERIVA
ncbi:MAG: alanine racemase, partial [bacterium]